MSLPTGTVSNAGSEFHFPSGTLMYAVKILGYPEIAVGEYDATTQGSLVGGIMYGQRQPNNRIDAGDFTLQLLEVTGHSALYTDQDAQTQRLCFIKGKVRTFMFTGYIKSVKPEDNSADSPDGSKLNLVVTPVGKITFGNV